MRGNQEVREGFYNLTRKNVWKNPEAKKEVFGRLNKINKGKLFPQNQKMVKNNFVIESFSDKHYWILVIIPEVSVYKSEKNILMIQVWFAENLFDYLHPFLFSDVFQQKLNKHQSNSLNQCIC